MLPSCWTHYVTLSYDLDLGFSILKKPYPRNRRIDWLIDMEHIGCESIGSCTHFVTVSWLHPWLRSWILKVKFSNCHISCMGLIYMTRKVCKLTGRWTHNVTLRYDLDLGFSRSNFKKLYSWSGVASLHGTKGIGVNRKSDPFCDF